MIIVSCDLGHVIINFTVFSVFFCYFFEKSRNNGLNIDMIENVIKDGT